MSKVNGFIKNPGLPGAPVVAANTAILTDWSSKGWVSDPGPATTPTFAAPAQALVQLTSASLGGRKINVPSGAVAAYNALGWA